MALNLRANIMAPHQAATRLAFHYSPSSARHSQTLESPAVIVVVVVVVAVVAGTTGVGASAAVVVITANLIVFVCTVSCCTALHAEVTSPSPS